MTTESPTRKQHKVLGNIFTSGRLSDAQITAEHKVGSSVIEVVFPDGRKDKLRMSPDGMLLGHWRNV